MRKGFLLMIVLLMSSVTFAQELTITYRGVYNTQSPTLFAEAGLQEEMRSSLANAYKDIVLTYQLTYKNGESEYRILAPKEKQSIVFMGQTLDISKGIEAQLQNYVYKNHQDGIILDKSSVFGKDFIVRDSIESEPYIINQDETKEILGFECKKAISADGKITAWFTSHISIQNEPFVCGLEGVILEYINDQQILTAIDIQDKVDHQLSKPEGKTISKKEFDDIIKKRVEMMKRN